MEIIRQITNIKWNFSELYNSQKNWTKFMNVNFAKICENKSLLILIKYVYSNPHNVILFHYLQFTSHQNLEKHIK